MPVANQIPESFIAGDTVQWRYSPSNYHASDGWVLVYTFVNATTRKQITAAADGAAFIATLNAEDSAAWPPADYVWSAVVTRDGERYTVDTGRITVRPDIAAAPEGGFDARSPARKVLEAIDAKLAGRASADQLDVIEYHIGMRGLRRTEDGLLKLRGMYAAAVWREENPGELCMSMGVSFE
jgi:hypothetical protein